MSTTPAIIDTHCHLDFAVFDEDRDQVLNRCAINNVQTIINPGVTADTWQRTINLSQSTPTLHFALGLHPQFIEHHQPQHLSQLDTLIETHRPVAVGEIGLDFYAAQRPQSNTGGKNPESSTQANREKQQLFFVKQLIIAKQHNLPVIIHNRKAHDLCLNLLSDTVVAGGTIHAFNGSIQQAHKYHEMGFMLGFGGMLTYERSSKLRALVKQLPLSAIVLETDAPDMTVSAHQGERNSPEYLPFVLAAVAEIKNLSVEQVAEVTSQNAQRIFNLT
ncbi:TatD family hydrolase [Arenicella xantha]|uniref:TatD DNase family protein n=1 Tax=Arenicella xantha TaxID=644221 RepID=A0A395JHQ4_9GAMM|nr:TatD family hydrolase [Arenicella xantha]RBP49616.1 TatD DNase family protein [Arenicella xantha]